MGRFTVHRRCRQRVPPNIPQFHHDRALPTGGVGSLLHPTLSYPAMSMHSPQEMQAEGSTHYRPCMSVRQINFNCACIFIFASDHNMYLDIELIYTAIIHSMVQCPHHAYHPHYKVSVAKLKQFNLDFITLYRNIC